MIQIRRILKVADNRPVRSIRCIGLKHKSTRTVARVGDQLLGAVRVTRPNRGWRRGQKVRAVLVRRVRSTSSASGMYVKFQENSVLLLNEKGSPIATRLKGPIPNVLREKGFGKLFALGARPV